VIVDARVKPAAVAADDLWYKDAIIYQLHVKSLQLASILPSP
jgi:hypothetical protein